MTIAELKLEPLTCPSCIKKINHALRKIDGVENESIDIRFNSSKVFTTFDSQKVNITTIVNNIEKLGYPVERYRLKAKM
ncbi:heavy-metal-associated domain-containing protein [Staphylococcus simiae]|uniref:heavy-metal-associated domain-containing protein n=1 Tax=Staphylococcus simiae TaxID=308354 RepID=UPI001A9603BF|nr:heavy-metal-associated domain-containing protein [Staphylococcus simiae]MBO1199852.1 heavy-metal-associated domain-containing protein [Staphylococcus simiae]MBO1202225.1 heavy-metal-associated domain-containing protein [Staphylococcus simiae]MBO1204486.1 heavy-metal-associated domain-containing protein [Staphylococcus simiae]MBO1211911.1 heavy-metal-associated domain-containing protein [Staphylococcus simiae]MBO1230671.1 heavy-metal-associated domain-containing protein [Staphylococcus simia